MANPNCSSGVPQVAKGPGGNQGFVRKRRKCIQPKSTFTTFMDEGVMHYRSGYYRKALYCFDRALELQPTHKAALVARSQCHLKLGDAASALRDAENSFEGNEVYIMGLYQYAEALYNLGLFEKALIAYHRGYRIRKVETFRIGIQKSQEAIRRAIGDRSATQIEDLEQVLPLIEDLEALANLKQEHCCIRPATNESELLGRKAGSKLKPPSKARSRWVAREILGQMYFDKDYLTKFLHRPDIQSDQGSSQELRSNATEALNYLEIREQFWRQQNPMYARKQGLNFNNNMVIQYEEQERERREASRRIKVDAAEGAVLKNISLIEHALSIGRAKDCQLECDRTLRQMKEISLQLLPRKPEFMCQVLHYKGLAFMKQKLYDNAAETFHQELNIATENKMTEVKARALDHTARAYALKGSYTDAAEIWESRMAMAKTSLERTYLFHEIGRCYLEMNKNEIAKYYGNQSLDEATKISDSIWMMNARILLGQVEIKNMQLDQAESQFSAAEKQAMVAGNFANLTLLREAQQCLKVWQEKREAAEKTPSTVKVTESSDSSDLKNEQSARLSQGT
ncbi:unnamed protein product [Allacma fusca]|uniref:Tetratricopeptide repeat protein 25 n=1 Tax=Allacma fusca TaxID=39272 RepID=A0A8J2J1W0_9HEXA|nr:unnamed protein product [Allacma fusca]